MDDDLELLPDVVDTPLWEFIDPDRSQSSGKLYRQLGWLYQAIRARENYYQENTPTAFGNPDYSQRVGIVMGFLMAMDAEEIEENGKIIIRTVSTGRKLLAIDKLIRPLSYYAELQENREILANL